MKWWTTLGLDLIVVLLFATIGRLSHGEAADPLGILTTAWPFVIALAGVTVALIGMQRPTDTWLNGLFVWAGTIGPLLFPLFAICYSLCCYLCYYLCSPFILVKSIITDS